MKKILLISLAMIGAVSAMEGDDGISDGAYISRNQLISVQRNLDEIKQKISGCEEKLTNVNRQNEGLKKQYEQIYTKVQSIEQIMMNLLIQMQKDKK